MPVSRVIHFLFSMVTLFPFQSDAARVLLPTPVGHIETQVRSWKTLRDELIVKQDKDYSCGAASVATLLNGQYGTHLSEEQVLMALDIGSVRASFDDIARAVPKLGFRAIGYAASFEQLTRLKIPVIVYLQHRKDDHFSVLRGVDRETGMVWLADSAQGNRLYSRNQFIKMWNTRNDEALAGRILVLLPDAAQDRPTDRNFFTSEVARRTRLTESMLPILNK